MKLTFIYICFLVSVQLHSQEWSLVKVDNTEIYSHQYRLQFQNKGDTSSYQIKKNTGDFLSIINISDNYGDTVSFANLIIKNIENDSVIGFTADHYGNLKIKLKKGKYSILVKQANYKNFELEFKLESNQFIELNLNLSLAPDLTAYTVYSKNKIPDNKIDEIVDCIKKNRHNFNKTCSRKDEFFISMEI